MQQVSSPGNRGIKVDMAFANKLRSSNNGHTLKFCYQCGICSSVCPISRYIGIYRPNRIIELAKLGIRNTPGSSAFLFCSACTLCTRGCPQNVRVHEIMQALKDQAAEDGDVRAFIGESFESIVEALGKEIPFPVSYSWICLRPPEVCESHSGGNIIRAALENALKTPPPQPSAPKPDARRVAVIGSGPAGLTAAWELARAGFAVDVFEEKPVPGGMLRTGIPGYRLPKDIVDTEIERIKAIGVRIHTGVKVDRALFDKLAGDNSAAGSVPSVENNINSDNLPEENNITVSGYEAVFIAAGMRASRKLNITGEDLQGVVPALDFLNEYNTAGTAKVGKNVVVIGGGNVATDSAGAALRCGAESVKLIYRRDRKKMPAHDWEIEEVLAEGVELETSWWPKVFHGDGGKVTSAEFVYCKSVTDKEGRFNPVFDEKKVLTAPADTVIVAAGQVADLSFLNDGVEVSRGYIQADPYTMETSLPNVFAGGDAISGAVGGAASLVEAIACGKTAALKIIGRADLRNETI